MSSSRVPLTILAVLTGLLSLCRSTLIDAHPFFRLLPNALLVNSPFLRSLFHLPKNYLNAPGVHPLLPANEAKM